MHVNFCGDADIAVTEETADKINILGFLVKKRAAGVTQLVRCQALFARDLMIIVERFELAVAEMVGGDVVAVQHGNKAAFWVAVCCKALKQILRDVQFAGRICRFWLICEPTLGGQCP